MELLPTAQDSQLRRDADLTHFDYYVLAMLSESPEHTMRMAKLAESTTATLARLSHVVQRLETRGLLERVPCPADRRATNARLTEAGWHKVQQAAPGHVTFVRDHVIDAPEDTSGTTRQSPLTTAVSLPTTAGQLTAAASQAPVAAAARA
jgi:DNA-binding MarR family transcriptional regulator